jgi:hypothetical protein
MATDLIRYDLLVQEALRGVVRNVLSEAARNGLQGEHHFFITFKTNAPGLRLSNRMRERYPDEMTIILQHQFWDLGVTEHAFEVGLSFSNVPERLLIPFAAITSFVDPSVQFGLKFDVQDPGQAAPSGKGDATEPARPEPAKRLLSSVSPSTALPPSKPVAVPVASAEKPSSTRPPRPAKPTLANVSDKDQAPDEKPEGEAAKVVSIDSFRKKP